MDETLTRQFLCCWPARMLGQIVRSDTLGTPGTYRDWRLVRLSSVVRVTRRYTGHALVPRTVHWRWATIQTICSPRKEGS